MHPCGVKTIGFDMGTACSCIGVWQIGRVEIILNDHGNNIERLIGDAAKNQVVSNLSTPSSVSILKNNLTSFFLDFRSCYARVAYVFACWFRARIR
uniref:Uncharacterized protein n=1 Tax=Populus trichocarpa TaxID=3694 RepID=A0A2K1YXH8_POPTR